MRPLHCITLFLRYVLAKVRLCRPFQFSRHIHSSSPKRGGIVVVELHPVSFHIRSTFLHIYYQKAYSILVTFQKEII